MAPEETLIETTNRLYAELWISLASLVRSYAAAHGLGSGRIAEIESGPERIEARAGGKRLRLTRKGDRVRREAGEGTEEFRLTAAGRLRSAEGEEEMDMAAERWARELMG